MFNLARAGEFCYVLTARQMGKSSLMIRTALRLKEQGVRTAIIDLTKIGSLTRKMNLPEELEKAEKKKG